MHPVTGDPRPAHEHAVAGLQPDVIIRQHDRRAGAGSRGDVDGAADGVEPDSRVREAVNDQAADRAAAGPDLEADMARIRALYDGIVPRRAAGVDA